jgi:hypothetical protein
MLIGMFVEPCAGTTMFSGEHASLGRVSTTTAPSNPTHATNRLT